MEAREVNMDALPPFPLPASGQSLEPPRLDLTLSLTPPSKPFPVHAADVDPFLRCQLAPGPSIEPSSRKMKRNRLIISADDSIDGIRSASSSVQYQTPHHHHGRLHVEGLDSHPKNFNGCIDGSAFVQYHPYHHHHAESSSGLKNSDDSVDGSTSVRYQPYHCASESLSDQKNLSAPRLSVADLSHAASMEGYGLLRNAKTLDGTATIQYCRNFEKVGSDPNNCLAKEARERRKMKRKDMRTYKRKEAQKKQKFNAGGSSILLHCVLKRWKKSLIKEEEEEEEKDTPCSSFYATIFEQEEEEEDKEEEEEKDEKEEEEEEEMHEALDSLYGCLMMEGYVSPTSFVPHSRTPSTLPNPNSFASIVTTTAPFSVYAPATMSTIIASTKIPPSSNFPTTTCYTEDLTRHNQLELRTRRSIGINPTMDGKYPLGSWKTDACIHMSPSMSQKETLIHAYGISSPLDQQKLSTRLPTTIGSSYCLASNAAQVTYVGANIEQNYLPQTICNVNNGGIDLHMTGKQPSSSEACMDESGKHPNTHWEDQERENSEQTKKMMIWVSTRINGKKSIHGLMHIIGKTCVRIVCTCHRKGMSPSKFVKHGGGVDISHPEKHIIVNLMHYSLPK